MVISRGPQHQFISVAQVFATQRVNLAMRKMLAFIGATIGGYAGWYLGAVVGFMTAFVLSMVGTGVGMYVAYRVAQNYE